MSFLFVLIASTASAETLRIGMVGAKPNLHPLKKQSDNGEFILNTLLEPLIALDKKWQWRCFLCSELPTLDNGQVRRLKDKRGTSYLRVSFEIRPDAKWGDGKKVTSKDVRFSWTVGRELSNPAYLAIDSVILDRRNPSRFSFHFKSTRYFYQAIGKLYLIPEHIEGPVWKKRKRAQNFICKIPTTQNRKQWDSIRITTEWCKALKKVAFKSKAIANSRKNRSTTWSSIFFLNLGTLSLHLKKAELI